MRTFNEKALKSFCVTGSGETYRLSRSIYGWQIRERTGFNEDTIFRTGNHSKKSYQQCLVEIQKYIDAGYGVIVTNFD